MHGYQYILDLMTWCGFAHVDSPTPEQIEEATKLDESYEAEEDILAIIQHPDFHKDCPALAGIRRVS